MRITRENVPQEQQPRPERRPAFLDAPVPNVVWFVLAITGVAALFSDALIAGAGLLGMGAWGVGRDAARRSSPDAASLGILRSELVRVTRERDAIGAEYLRLQQRISDGRAAPAGGGEQPPAPPAARPSASVRGGGRPGAAGKPAPLRPLDAPLPGEGRATDDVGVQ